MTAPFLVDSHCHLYAEQFEDIPVPDILDRAAAEGIGRMVNIGTDLATSRRALDLAAAHAPLYATVGIDPGEAGAVTEADLAELAGLAAQPKVVAIGEIGLDYHWMVAPKEVQERVFRAQLDLAASLDLPVVIHCREAHEDNERILLGWSAARLAAGHRIGRPLGVMHCFSGDLDTARRLVAAGFLISLAGPVTYKNAARTQEVATDLPLESLVLETDAPYLAPVPHRGGRNEPAYLRRTAEFVAQLRQISLEAIARATTANAARLFGWDMLGWDRGPSWTS